MFESYVKLAAQVAASLLIIKIAGVGLAWLLREVTTFVECAAIDAGDIATLSICNDVGRCRCPKHGYQIIHAIRSKNVAVVERMISTWSSLNIDYGQDTLLTAAVRTDHHAMVQMLVGRGAAVNIDTTAGVAVTSGQGAIPSPLLLAVQLSQTNMVHLLLRLGANPDGSPSDIMAPLTHASRHGNIHIAQMLMEAGASRGNIVAPHNCRALYNLILPDDKSGTSSVTWAEVRAAVAYELAPVELPADDAGLRAWFACAVCLEVAHEPVRLAAGASILPALYCNACARAWLRENDSCPVTRARGPRVVAAPAALARLAGLVARLPDAGEINPFSTGKK